MTLLKVDVQAIIRIIGFDFQEFFELPLLSGLSNVIGLLSRFPGSQTDDEHTYSPEPSVTLASHQQPTGNVSGFLSAVWGHGR